MMSQQDSTIDPRRFLAGATGAAALWALGVLTYAWWGPWTGERLSLPEGPYANIGAWGDAFAPLTGLFSVFAVVVALQAVRMQKTELQLQREEMIASRKQFQLQAEAQHEQAHAQEQANHLALLARQQEALRLLREIQQRGEQLLREAAPLTRRNGANELRFQDLQLPVSVAWNEFVQHSGEPIAYLRAALEMPEERTRVLRQVREQQRFAQAAWEKIRTRSTD